MVPCLLSKVSGVHLTGGAAHSSFSDSGSLVYVQGRADVNRNLVWVDRDGREEALSAEPRAYTYPRISPMGTKLPSTCATRSSTSGSGISPARR